MPAETCPTCGRLLDAHDRHVRFRLPDPVLAIPEEGREGRTWGDDVLLAVRDVGCFVRCLLPVRLRAGHSVTFGVWLGVEPAALQHAWERWWAPDYGELVLDGLLANDVLPWGLLGRRAHAVVRNPDEVPYVVSSDDPLVARVLDEEWEHAAVLAALP